MKTQLPLASLAVLAAVTVFALDITTPSGVAVAVLYVGVVLMSLGSRSPASALVLGGLSTALTLVAFGFSMWVGDEPLPANSGLALLAIWLTALLCYRQIQATQRLAASKDDLARRVVKSTSEAVMATAAMHSERDDRVRAEEERRLAEQRYRAVFNQTFQLVAMLSPEGAVLEANETMLSAGGLREAEVAGRPIWELALWRAQGTPEKIRALVDEAAGGNFCRDEMEVAPVDAEAMIVDVSVKPIRDAAGWIDMLILEARDITEHRANEELLLHAQKMEVVGQLTGGIAHDFNNLLTVVAGNIELVGRRVRDDDYLAKRIEKAVNAVFQGKALTEQLLAFARKQQLAPQAVDLRGLLAAVQELLDRTVEEHILLETDLAEDLWQCWADPNQLQTAILNLVLNARDAMPAGGRIALSGANVTLPRQDGEGLAAEPDLPAGDYVLLRVIDQGAGIAPAILDQVLQPFFTTKPAGTGLGLSMAYGFMKQSGGDIRIASAPGEGTTVSLYLPRLSQAAPGPACETPKDSAERGARILVVEDNEAVREVAVSILSDLGYVVEQAIDGDAAVDLLHRGRAFDLVLTDVMMPGGHSGRALADVAKSLQPQTRILFSSGHPARTDEARPANFIAKPYHYDDLAREVARMLARPG